MRHSPTEVRAAPVSFGEPLGKKLAEQATTCDVVMMLVCSSMGGECSRICCDALADMTATCLHPLEVVLKTSSAPDPLSSHHPEHVLSVSTHGKILFRHAPRTGLCIIQAPPRARTSLPEILPESLGYLRSYLRSCLRSYL